MRQHRPLFHLFLPLQTHTLQILQQISLWKMSIQYMVPGFELWNMSLLPQPLDQGSRQTSTCAHLLTLSRYFIACGKSYKWNLFALDDSTSSTFENLHSHIYSLACLRTGHGKLDECIHLLFIWSLPSFESFVLDLRNTFQNLISLGRTGMEKV